MVIVGHYRTLVKTTHVSGNRQSFRVIVAANIKFPTNLI